MSGRIPEFLLKDRDKEYNIPFYSAKVVTASSTLSKAERIKKIKAVGFNVFSLNSEDVAIDLLTDSGTGSISDKQLSAMMLGDEAYAGSTSFFKMKKAINEIMGLPYVIPTHQGRGAEKTLNYVMTYPKVRKEQTRILKEVLKNKNKLSEKELEEKINALIDCNGKCVPEVFVPGNTHFDTTASHIEFVHAQPVDFTIQESKDSSSNHPFKGNLDTERLKKFLDKLSSKFGKENVKEHVPYILLTITCNSAGGQPVSMQNIAETKKVAEEFNIPLFFDAARFAENAFLIKKREKKYRDYSIKDIVHKMFSFVDGCTMSAKKEGLVPMGGFIAVRSKELYEQLAAINILFEGFKTYGGMSGLMMEAIAQGLHEAIDYNYLRDRVSLVRYLAKGLRDKGIPIVEPVGGHAVYVDARKFYKGIIPEDQFPAQALTAFLYIESGVRAVEIGSCLKGRDPITGENKRVDLDLMRLTIPRRKYNKDHMDTVIKALTFLYENRKNAKGLRILPETEPKFGIRHFTVKFELVD